MPINSNRVFDVVRIAQDKLKELCRSHRGEDGMLGRDSQVQHIHNVVTLAELSTGYYCLEDT